MNPVCNLMYPTCNPMYPQVAAAYVAMGLLPASRAAHTSLPSHFASRHRRRLPLQGGASLIKEP